MYVRIAVLAGLLIAASCLPLMGCSSATSSVSIESQPDASGETRVDDSDRTPANEEIPDEWNEDPPTWRQWTQP